MIGTSLKSPMSGTRTSLNSLHRIALPIREVRLLVTAAAYFEETRTVPAVPRRRESSESHRADGWRLWIPGSQYALTPRNDGGLDHNRLAKRGSGLGPAAFRGDERIEAHSSTHALQLLYIFHGGAFSGSMPYLAIASSTLLLGSVPSSASALSAAHCDIVAVDLEELAQRDAIIAATEAVGAKTDIAPGNVRPDLIGKAAHIVRRRDDRSLRWARHSSTWLLRGACAG